MKNLAISAIFALGVIVGLVSPSLLANAEVDPQQNHETYELEWEKLARDPAFRKAIAVVVNEACIVNNSMIYCD